MDIDKFEETMISIFKTMSESFHTPEDELELQVIAAICQQDRAFIDNYFRIRKFTIGAEEITKTVYKLGIEVSAITITPKQFTITFNIPDQGERTFGMSFDAD